ncbi:MAG: hypothetical protein ABSC02_06245 [Acidobacteriota bacterium]|jgi:sugar lactone lactonase YvrE
MDVITRRRFIRFCASLYTASIFRDATATPVAPAFLKTSLGQEYANATAKAISPDGKRLCLEDWRESGYPLHVVETDSWRTIYRGRFKDRVLFASFFSDSRALYVEGPGGAGEHAFWWGVVDLADGRHIEGKQSEDFKLGGIRPISAAFDRQLLIFRYTQPYQTQTVELIELPSYREMAKTPYATEPREPRRHSFDVALSNDFGFGISADRNILAYSFDHTLVSRRTKDLQLLWTRQIEPGMYAHNVVVSAGGERVAAALTDNGFSYLQKMYCVAVYDGKNGNEVAKLPISGTDGIAISPDGKLVAAVERVYSKGKVSPTIHIHDLSTGEKLTTLTHDVIKSGRHQFLEAGCTVSFNSDGKYLITSGMVTNIWRLGE